MKNKGITLIALIITIIVLLILAGISIALVLGDNGILTKSKTAKRETVIEQAKEQIRLAIYAAQADSEGEEIAYNDLVKELNNQFGTGGFSISDESADEWIIIVTTSEGDVSESVSSSKMTIGKAFTNDWMGKMIEYEANGENQWVIIGQDENKNVLITTLYPVGSYTTNHTIESWCDYEKNLNNACEVYESTIGAKNVNVIEARSLTMDDVVNCLGINIPETFDEYTFTTESGEKNLNLYYPDENNKVWVQPTASNTWKRESDCFNLYVSTYYTDTNTVDVGYRSKNIDSMQIDAERPNNYMIFDNVSEYYWIGTKFMNVYQDREAFFYVARGNIYGNGIGYDYGNGWQSCFMYSYVDEHGNYGNDYSDRRKLGDYL